LLPNRTFPASHGPRAPHLSPIASCKTFFASAASDQNSPRTCRFSQSRLRTLLGPSTRSLVPALWRSCCMTGVVRALTPLVGDALLDVHMRGAP
jgi:hypothetical protein